MVARKARLEDAAALYGLVCLYSRAAPPREVFDAYYALALEDGARRLLIAWEGDEAVGFADAQQRDSLMLGKKVGVIQDFFVREAAEGRGLCGHHGLLPQGGRLQPGIFGKARLCKREIRLSAHYAVSRAACGALCPRRLF